MTYSSFKRSKRFVLLIMLWHFLPCQSERSEEDCSLKQWRETVDGVEWMFIVNNGSATIRNGDTKDSAILKDVKGNVLVPSRLGGMPVRKIGKYAFYECTNVVSISVSEGITNVSAAAFLGCQSLQHVELPQSVEVLGPSAFRDCVNLKSVVVPPRVKIIHPNTFLRCVNLTQVSLPMGVESIGGGAFSCCRRLPSIKLPDSLVTISDGAFIRCESLRDIEIPASVTRVGENVFTGCSALRNIRILGNPVFLSTARNLITGEAPSIRPSLKNVYVKSHDFHDASIMSIVKAMQEDTLPILNLNGMDKYSVVMPPDVLNSELRFSFYLPSMPLDEAFRYIGMKVGVMVTCDGNCILLSALPRLDGDVTVSFDDVNVGTNSVFKAPPNPVSRRHNTPQVVRIWLETPSYDSCPRTFRALACQEHLLSEYKGSGYMLPVDLTFYVRNDTDFPMRIGEEQFTCGYYCLEIDVRQTNGTIFVARRKEGVWYRNLISEEEICGEKIHRRLLSMNPRLWTGLPSEVSGDKVYLRPRFAFFSFVNAGRHYKSTSDLRAGRESKSWHGSREGELVGDWLIVSADRYKSWMHSDLSEEKRIEK